MINKKIVFKNDILGRENFAENLTKLIDNGEQFTENNSLVIAIDSNWGTGKTTFIENWHSSLKEYKDHYFSIKYNAWENDDWDDAFIPILNHIICNMDESIKKTLIEDIKFKATDLAKYIGKGLVKYVINKFDDELFDTIDDVLKTIVDSESCNEWFRDMEFEKVNQMIKENNFDEILKHINREKINAIIFKKKKKKLGLLSEYEKYEKAKKEFIKLLQKLSKTKKVVVG